MLFPMTTSQFLKGFVATLILFLAGDIVWHNFVMRDFYMQRILAINGPDVAMGDFPPFILAFEIIASAGMSYFVLRTSKTLMEGALNGAFLGLVVVAGINFVAHSLIPKWDVPMVLVDTAWGVVLGAVAGKVIMLVAGRRKA